MRNLCFIIGDKAYCDVLQLEHLGNISVLVCLLSEEHCKMMYLSK